MTLTKADITEYICDEIGLNQRESKDVVESFFGEIRHTLATNEEVKLSGFGNFNLRDKKPRPGRNPKTGEVKMVDARRVVTFHPGEKLKDKVSQYE